MGISIINSAALLITLVFIYVTLPIRENMKSCLREILTGILIGIIGIAIILTPWHLSKTITFDTISILLSTTGFFLGLISTTIAVLITGFFHLFRGREGFLKDILIIVSSSGLGILWRYIFTHKPENRNKTPKWFEFYIFGIIVHAIMLFWTFMLPPRLEIDISKRLILPIIIIYPIVTLLLGILLADQQRKKQIQNELNRNERFLAGILNSIQDGISILNPDLTIRYTNSVMKQWYMPHLPLEGKQCYAVYQNSDKPCNSCPTLRAMKTGKVESNIVPGPPNSPADWIELYSYPMKDPATNKITGVIEFVRDITKQKNALDALRESEERFKGLAETTSTAIFVYNGKRFLYVNTATTAITGYSEDELLHSVDFWQIIHPQYRDFMYEKFVDRGRGMPTPERYEFKIICKDKTVKWIDFTAGEIEWFGERAFIGSAIDITMRKQAEEERERLMTAIEQAGETVVITDTEGIIQYVNPAFERISGYSSKEAIGQNPRILQSGKHSKQFYRELWQTITSGKTWKGRFINKKKDGSIYIEEATISPVHDITGKIINYIAVKRDITEQLKLEEQFLQAQKMQSVGRLAGGIAHDFNNMLTVIMGHIEILMASDISPSIKKELQEIKKAAEHSSDITKKLLAFARKQTIDLKVLNINETIERMLKMLTRLIGENIDFSWKPAKNLWSVKMDPTQINQILTNLCVNAKDAISGNGKITIETENITFDETYCSTHEGFSPGDYVMIAVSDNGCGMDRETIKKIFEPFFTTKEIGKGTGLGLATVYGIVKQNRGFINVYSEEGKGTTFKIYIPHYTGKQRKTKPKISSLPYSSNGETILIVEDEISILNFVKTILENHGHSVLTASNPTEALKKQKNYQGTINLLITDVVMPEMNGKELSETLKKIHPNIKTLYMSGYTANTIAHHGVLEENVNFIQKPFTIKDFLLTVRKAIES